MPRPLLSEAQRKKPRAVSLTDAQNAKLMALGGSPWLQAMLDAHPTPTRRPAAKKAAR